MNTGLLLALGLAAAVVALVWFVFMAPLDKQMHQRRLDMIQRKIEKRKQAARERCNADDGGEQ